MDTGHLGDYEIHKASGIGKKGEAAPKKSIDEATVLRIRAALDSVCPEGTDTRVTRHQVATAMGEPGSPTEALIAKALGAGQLPGFTSKKGAGGGIFRLAEVTSEGTETEEETEA
jgi:hypothetical protein